MNSSLPSSCYHGGAFFNAIGPEFNHLERRHSVIAADVLDAWFPPSPKVIAALTADLPWLLRTSPPTHSEGMTRVIARARGVEPENILPGAGSSDLIFLAFRQWLNRSSRVLILDPTYGEYAHVLEKVIGCRVDRLVLGRDQDYRVDLAELEQQAQQGYDFIVLVNPNSPTGQSVPRRELEASLRKIPASTRVWLDETYIEYAGPNQSLERFTTRSENVVICKSMSKVYALSGVRAAYLCGPETILAGLRSITPPWAVSLPAQVAAIAALQAPDYYAARYAETHVLRTEFASELQQFDGWKILPGIANFVLCHLPQEGLSAAALVTECRRHNLFLRNADAMGSTFGDCAVRIAVKDAETNRRMLDILKQVARQNMPELQLR
jgi:histidinol-phosphate/aromatic aminotransferase/cobyric acid decarboxylase-like protein